MSQRLNRGHLPRLGSRLMAGGAVISVILALIMVACTSPSQPPASPAPPHPRVVKPATPPAPPPPSVADGINRFSLDLYRGVSSQPGNLILSPASVYLGLAQVMAGARGATETEFRNSLHVSLPNNEFHRAFGGLYQDLVNRGSGDFKLKWASRFWVRQGFDIIPAYSDLLQASYLTATGRFSSPQVAGEINDWVSQQTEKEIPEVIKPDQITDKSVLLLVNAIFFHGYWLTPFPEDATQSAPFHLLAGSSVQTPMMNLKTECPVGQAEGFRFLTLWYKGGGMAMTILLPDSPDGLPALEQSLDWEKLKNLLAAAQTQPVFIGLPKFKFENTYELTQNLQSSLPTVFGEKSDLSGIGDPGPGKFLYISSIIHVAKVEVEETGTKAAAATVVNVMGGAPSVEPRPAEFIADHPFLFLIQDVKTGMILFMGRVADPR